MTEKLVMKNVCKKYPGSDKYSVKDFSIDIKDGEFIVFVGPSGSGKSTALRMIAGLESITEGDLYIDGERMNDIEPKDRNIAMVFQNYALFPHLTVRENIGFGLKIRGMNKDERNEKIEHAAKTVGLTEHLEKHPGALSGGQMQRVALARALVKDANIYLMDEPLSNLDAKLRTEMRNEISTLMRRGHRKTTIYVTHDQAEAMTMASRIVVINFGEIQQIGTPYEIYNDPDNMFVAGFLGSPAMNFIRVSIKDDKITSAGGQLLIHSDRVRNIPAGEYIMGARPEHIYFGEGDIAFKVRNAELLGSEYNIHGEFEGIHMTIMMMAEKQMSRRGEATIRFDLDDIFLFDPQTEERVRFDG